MVVPSSSTIIAQFQTNDLSCSTIMTMACKLFIRHVIEDPLPKPPPPPLKQRFKLVVPSHASDYKHGKLETGMRAVCNGRAKSCKSRPNHSVACTFSIAFASPRPKTTSTGLVNYVSGSDLVVASCIGAKTPLICAAPIHCSVFRIHQDPPKGLVLPFQTVASRSSGPFGQARP